jgi:hypothetical protein
MSANNRVSILVIVSILVFSTSFSVSFGKSPSSPSKEWPKASEKVYKLYRALHDKIQLPELMIKQINDTLSYGQFWPDDKFEIIKRNGVIYIPLGIWTGGDSCYAIGKYIEHDSTIIMFSTTQAKYMIPLEDLPLLTKTDCIKNYEMDYVFVPAINILTDKARQNRYDKYCSISEDYYTAELVLGMSSKGWFENSGYRIIGYIEYNESTDQVKITTTIKSPVGLVHPALWGAGGSVSFIPPSDSFDLDLDDDKYTIILDKDSIYIKPLDVCDNIITNHSAPRIGAESFAIVFDPDKILENPINLSASEEHRKNIIMNSTRDSIISVFKSVGADFMILNRADLGLYDVYTQHSVNYVVDTIKQYSEPGKGKTRYSLFFNYSGDKKKIIDNFEHIAREYPGTDLLWVRDDT